MDDVGQPEGFGIAGRPKDEWPPQWRGSQQIRNRA